MANSRTPGTVGSENGRGSSSVGGYGQCTATGTNQSASTTNGSGLTPEQEELALDIAQITLDIVGIFEPTPFADGTNALISIGRGDWFGAALSGISCIPYIGDLAKAGKLPRYAQKMYDAIALAKRDPAFARVLRPALEKLKAVLDTIPDNLSPKLKEMVDKIRRPIDGYLGVAKVKHRLSLLDRLVLARMGSLRNVGDIVWTNVEIARDYFVRHGIPEEKMIDALNGIDVHKAVEVVSFKKGDIISTSMVLKKGDKVKDLSPEELAKLVPGEWFVKAGGGVGKESVGLAHGSRQVVHFEVTQPASMLKSKAAHVDDFWTDGIQTNKRLFGDQTHTPLPNGPGTKRKPWTQLDIDPKTGQVKIKPATDPKTGEPFRDAEGKLKTSLGIGTRGGGTQYFFPKNAQKGNNGLRIKVTTRAINYGTNDRKK